MELELILQTPLFPVPKGVWTAILQGSDLGWGDLSYIDHVVTWQIKDVISPLSQSLWTPNLDGLWLKMRGSHPQSHVTLRYRGHVTNKKHISISPLSQGLWTPNLAEWWRKMREPNSQSHVIHRSRGYVTNNKRLSSTFT